VWTKAATLSGGERNRLMLAKLFTQPANVLVLDEPTNDLDLETLDVLEEMLGDYAGTVVLISHDRDFLDRIVSAVVVPEGDGKWAEYAGGYTDMLTQRGEDLSRKPEAKAKSAGKTPAAPREQKPAKRRMTFNDKHALETLPGRMAALQQDIRKLQVQLDDPGLYTRDPRQFSDVSTALGAAQTELAASEERWLELEILREEIESS
jgi:ATP-binding cassette subfamily F protein uup